MFIFRESETLEKEENKLIKERGEVSGRENEMKESIRRLKRELQDDMFKDAEKKHRDKEIELSVSIYLFILFPSAL